jgi:flavin reductase (DIM6/NTAB) family NADH-FMN oxidoreductase RutF
MKRQTIPFDRLSFPLIQRLNNRWMLLAAGDNTPGGFNVMTVSWGGLGVIWNKPLAIVLVRPSRFTYTFIEKCETFTLSVFPGEFKDQLTLCGTRSGRAMDKVKACGFTPIPSASVTAPSFDEAELILECRKTYFTDLDPSHFIAPYIEANYGGRDYHRMYFGEILSVQGSVDYSQKTP